MHTPQINRFITIENREKQPSFSEKTRFMADFVVIQTFLRGVTTKCQHVLVTYVKIALLMVVVCLYLFDWIHGIAC